MTMMLNYNHLTIKTLTQAFMAYIKEILRIL